MAGITNPTPTTLSLPLRVYLLVTTVATIIAIIFSLAVTFH